MDEDWRLIEPQEPGDCWQVHIPSGENWCVLVTTEETVARLIHAAPKMAEQLQLARAMLALEAQNNRERGEPQKADPVEGFCKSIAQTLANAGKEHQPSPSS